MVPKDREADMKSHNLVGTVFFSRRKVLEIVSGDNPITQMFLMPLTHAFNNC